MHVEPYLNDYIANRLKSVRADLEKLGFDVDKLTDTQIDLILQPSDGPENYHCDGEITPSEAKRNWLFKLKNSGLSDADIMRAVKYNFG